MNDLDRLARAYGVVPQYREASGRLRRSPPESVLTVLQALGAAITRPEEARSALRQHKADMARRLLDPVIVHWQGSHLQFALHTEANPKAIRWSIVLENGSEHLLKPRVSTKLVNDRVLLTARVTLPPGYHHLHAQSSEFQREALIISAPQAAYGADFTRAWSLFAPLYAVESATSWGGGDYTVLASLSRYVAARGGKCVATLPLLPVSIESDTPPSPYAPLSRLFWSEFYVDVLALPELVECETTRKLIEASSFQESLRSVKTSHHVDYFQIMRLKRQVLEALAAFVNDQAAWREQFARFLRESPQTADYAAFRAYRERHGRPPPAGSKPGSFDDVPSNPARYHAYAQWCVVRQFERAATEFKHAKHGFYLDLPIGVDASGYDAWRFAEVFASGLTVGAPPDPFFSHGQNWGFAPLHPERILATRFAYPRAYLTLHMRVAGMLRIDHVMGFHRLFCIPQGGAPSDGVYIRYKAEPWYALLCLESQRHQSVLVGENLGTVPPEANRALRRHGIFCMQVLQFAMKAGRHLLPRIPKGTVASLNTHDTPTFAAFWRGLDIEARLKLGLLDAQAADREARQRTRLRNAVRRRLGLRAGTSSNDSALVLQALLRWLMRSSAPLVLVNLEDLWLETAPQNTPGTTRECLNWQRKATLQLEAIERSQDIHDFLETLTVLRRRPHARLRT